MTIAPPTLSRQERFDFVVNRAAPKVAAKGHRFILRLTGVRLGASKRGIPVGLLTTIGAKSGKQRVVPLMYMPDGERFIVVAANSGFDHHPAWFINLRSKPTATFTTRGGRRHVVEARVLSGDEREQLWPRLVAHNPLWGSFQEMTTREAPVVALEPR